MNPNRRALIVIAAVLVALYVALAVLVNARLLTSFDLSSIRWLQVVIPRVVDLPFTVLSLVGSFEITVVFVFVVLFFLFKPRYRLQLFLLFGAIVMVEWLGKEFISQPGPGRDFKRMVRLFSMPTSNLYTPFSFPSGHAARSAFISVLLAAWTLQCRLDSRVKWALVGVIIAAESVMLVSRVYLGEHWSTDVIAGTVLGLLFALPAFSNRVDPPR